ncbi:MAG: hypothetical protein LUO89_13915 [Methanothrix sp.]|nr:hypothetical protein [Methanothrix sp.]
MPEDKTSGQKAADNFSAMFQKFGEAMSEIFNDPELKQKAKELGDSAAASAKTLGKRFQDKEVKEKFREVGKAAEDFGKSVSDYFSEGSTKKESEKKE